MQMNELSGAQPRSRARSTLSWTDGNSVFDLGDSGRRPGGPLGFFALSPRSHGSLENDLAPVGIDGDAIGIDLREAFDGALDLPLDVGGLDLRLEHHIVDGPAQAL